MSGYFDGEGGRLNLNNGLKKWNTLRRLTTAWWEMLNFVRRSTSSRQVAMLLARSGITGNGTRLQQLLENKSQQIELTLLLPPLSPMECDTFSHGLTGRSSKYSNIQRIIGVWWIWWAKVSDDWFYTIRSCQWFQFHEWKEHTLCDQRTKNLPR